MPSETKSVQDRLEDIMDELERIRRQTAILGDTYNLSQKTKNTTNTINGIVPVICSDADIPAEIYYAYIGANCDPEWVGAQQNLVVENWDATDKRLYAQITGTNDWYYGGRRFAWPTGAFGESHSFDPKKADVSVFTMEFRARFDTNADYTVYGIGLLNSTPGVSTPFSTATDHFIQVTRNAGSWELGTCDGATISQSSGGSADGNLHTFLVEWQISTITLYIDGVSTITKTTNLPAQSLTFAITGSAAGAIDITAVKMTWR